MSYAVREDEAMFVPGSVWIDTDGEPIQAHGGGVLYDQGVYYWFGENKAGPTIRDWTSELHRVDVIGISCYSSTDLYHWTNRGVVLPAVADDPAHDLHPSKVVERPKVVYNDETRQYVMWLHVDHPDYTYAHAGVAVSDAVTGPYRYLGSVGPHGGDSRDMTVFKDDEGSAYLIFSSEWNRNVTIARLSGDYLRVDDACFKALSHPCRNGGREAPAVFKHAGMYYMITSGCTGWAPNAAAYAISSSMTGSWEPRGNPCTGTDAEHTFHSQGTFVLPVVGKPGAYIFMADRWQPTDLRDSRYVWLPLVVDDTELSIPWTDRWDLSVFGRAPSESAPTLCEGFVGQD
jgi:beta-xylosidase